MWRHFRTAGMMGAVALLGAGVGLAGSSARAQQSVPQQWGLPPAALGGPCLHSGRAYLRARIRGAVRLDVALLGPQLACEGGPRLDGTGLRMGFEGRVGPAGRRLRMVFGIDGAKEGRPGRELPTNLTVIFEGEQQIFATQGDGNCTVDRLTQKAIDIAHGRARAYRVVAHGFCIAPANDVGGHRRILVTTFDFAGRADFNTP